MTRYVLSLAGESLKRSRCSLSLAALISEADSFLWRQVNDDESIGTSFVGVLDRLLFAIRKKRVVVS